MKDTAFEPQSIAIEAGETVRFVVKNEGELVHEFNVGTAAMHAEHQKQMAMMVDHGMLGADKINHDAMMGGGQMGGGQMMMHDDPNSVLLEPGQSGEVVLKFTNPTKLEFACNVPGHYEAGMVGTHRRHRVSLSSRPGQRTHEESIVRHPAILTRRRLLRTTAAATIASLPPKAFCRRGRATSLAWFPLQGRAPGRTSSTSPSPRRQ